MTTEAVLQVTTTTDAQEKAEQIARALIDRHLAACVQVSGPISSFYRWQGKVEAATEWSCTAKTTQSKYAEVERAIRELHSYDEPEIVATEIVAGSASYLNWVRNECGKA